MTFTPSKYQQAIFDVAYENQWKNLMVMACAGSGKTTTGTKMYQYFPPNLDIMFCAFNKSIQLALAEKGVIAKTYHALGLQGITQSQGRVQIDADKTEKMLKNFLSRDQYGFLYPPIKRLVSLCKNTLVEPINDNLWELSLFHNIDLYSDNPELPDIVFDETRFILDATKRNLATIDFDDMVWLPLVLNLPIHKYDILLVDEYQDTNMAQQELALKSGERICGFGDPHQAIYGFRGADTEAIPRMVSKLDAQVMPLSITYRNPSSVVQWVNNRFPNIPFEGTDWAIPGTIQNIRPNDFLEKIVPGDMILCRVNAPMVQYVFQLLREGKKATILGRDIGQGLISLIKKMKCDDLETFFPALQSYVDKECYRLQLSERYSLIQILQDKLECIMVLSEGCTSVYELINRIQKIFSDEQIGIVFSSVHKAKGLEAKNVFILHPELMPHPLAKQQWERDQEENILYVATTRTLENLYFVQ